MVIAPGEAEGGDGQQGHLLQRLRRDAFGQGAAIKLGSVLDNSGNLDGYGKPMVQATQLAGGAGTGAPARFGVRRTSF